MKPILTCDPSELPALNAAMHKELLEHGDGMVKGASAGATDFIRTYQVERGWARSLNKVETPDRSRLRKYVEHEGFDIMDNMQPGSPGASTLNINSAPEIHTYTGDRFLTSFFDISTRRHSKNVRHLEVYDYDLRQVVTDLAMNQIEVLEDTLYLRLVDGVVGEVDDFEIGTTAQYVNFPTAQGGISRTNYQRVSSLFYEDTIALNKALVNKTTFGCFAGMPATEVGGDLAEKTWREGVAGLGSGKVMGIDHLVTIKHDIVPTGTIYLFTEPGYLGKFYVWREPTMQVEKKGDIVSFHAIETIGWSIANLRGVRKVTFETVAADPNT